MMATTRGGLVPGAIVARELDVQVIETICIASDAQEKIQGEMKIPARGGEALLVVWDLADTARR